MTQPQHANQSQLRNAQRASAGVSSRVQDGALGGGQLLQRTLGNAYLINAVARGTNDDRGADGGGKRSEVYGRTFESIMQRAAAFGGQVSPKVRQRGKGPLVQRLMSSTDFYADLKVAMPGDKIAPLFREVGRDLELLDLISDEEANYDDRSKVMQKIYTSLYKWMLSDESDGHAARTPVQKLMDEIVVDMKRYRESGVQDLAHTATGTSPKTPSLPALTAPSKDQLEASRIIEGARLTSGRRAHAKATILNPSLIQQGAFGVCGLTSILFVVATSDPKRFAEMIKEAWSVRGFVSKWLPVFFENATPEQRRSCAEVEYIASQWLVRRSVGQTEPVKQKILDTNDPNQKVEKKDVYYRIYDKQLKFSDSFEMEGWENTLGHFALTTGALTYLLNTVGSKPAYKVRINDFEHDYLAAKAKAGTGTVLASVTNTDFYDMDGAEVDDVFIKTGKPKYVHWVTLRDVEKDGDYFKLKIWTWTADWVAKVHKDVIKTHIHSLIAAESDG